MEIHDTEETKNDVQYLTEQGIKSLNQQIADDLEVIEGAMPEVPDSRDLKRVADQIAGHNRSETERLAR